MKVFFARNSNLMENSPCHNSVAGHQIATNFCTCHDSTAVVPCTKLCSDRCVRIEVRVKRNSHRIWFAMQKPLVKRPPGWCPGPDSRNDPLAIGSDTILWSWSADRIPQTPITIGSSDRENTKPNSLLPIESWHKSFTGKFRIEITWSWLNEKRQTDDIYPWRHNGRCDDVIYECRYESVMASSVHAHSVCSRYNTVWTCHIRQVCVCDYRDWKYIKCWHKTDHVPVQVSQ